MTFHEAIRELQSMRRAYTTPAYCDSLDMAINALTEKMKSQRRFVVEESTIGMWNVIDSYKTEIVSKRIPDKAEALSIADIYERMYQ